MSSVTTPLAAAGYYVFPVAVVDTYFKENGLATAAEMHGAPLDKIRDVFGADAVLYLDVKQYGQEYNIVSSAKRKLISPPSWSTPRPASPFGTVVRRGASHRGGGNADADLLGLLATAALAQAIGTTADASHGIAVEANRKLILGSDGLLLGPLSRRWSCGHARGRPPEAAPAATEPDAQGAPAESAAVTESK